jgi:hypothetical protein
MEQISPKIIAWLPPATIEPEALQQLYNIAEMPFVFKHLAVMPDCHLGRGATVGTVIATTDEDWMVTKNVGFSIVLPETFSYTGPGSLLFKKDDPSDGEAPFDPVKDQYSIPVVFEDQ